MPCIPAMTFCSIVGHASFQTAWPMGPSTMDRSNFLDRNPDSDTETKVYYRRQGKAVRCRLREGLL